jgi:predicted type IV restriction endonuclease
MRRAVSLLISQNKLNSTMNNNLNNLLRRIKGNSSILSYNEDATKQSVILPLLQTLNWDIFNPNEVAPEFTIKSKRVDYSLRLNGRNWVFIEAKRPGANLENHQNQLLDYSFQEGVKLAILTNGNSWWFYLPLREGSWEKRKFYSVDIQQQNLNEIQQKFKDFLSKKNIKSNQAFKNAENVFDSRIKAKEIKTTLPKAWNKLVSEPDEFLIELLKEKVENLSGYVPAIENLEYFFENNIESLQINQRREAPTSHKPKSRILKKSEKNKNPVKKVKEHELVESIVQVLKDLGGRASKQEVENEIYKHYQDIFENKWYQGSVSHGIPRWKHNIAWAKEKAKHEGLVKPPSEAGRGIWELTDDTRK